MCGRYTFFTDKELSEIDDIIEQVDNDIQRDKMKTGEIFPTNIVPVLLQDKEVVMPRLLVWGFPQFHKKGVIINARSETAYQKPMFRSSLENRRCVIPSTGFYEWDKNKNKYQFNLPDSQLLYMAGLYNQFDGEGRFVILTTEANNSISDIHERMPVVLAKSQIGAWITDSRSASDILYGNHPDLVRRLSNPDMQVQMGL